MKAAIRAIVLCAGAVVLGAGLFLGWLIYTPGGARFAVQQIVTDTLESYKVTWEGMEGDLASGITVRHLQVKEIPRLPPGSFLRVQKLSVRLSSPALSGLALDIDHARLFPRGEEAIVLNGKVRGNRFAANVYSRSLDLGDMRDALMKFFDVPAMKGTLRDIDLIAVGSFERPWISGRFIAERLEHNGFLLEECPVQVKLHFLPGAAQWETYGRMDLLGGWLQSPAVRFDLLKSRLTFAGRAAWPELNINAAARVLRTRIDIKVRGSRKDPLVFLSSDMPYPKEQLLLMLATGRRWSGMEGAVNGNPMTPQLASDFVEYLLFGGSRGKIVEWFGLSDISLIADEKAQGVSLTKDLTDRLGLGYGIKVGPKPADKEHPREVTQTIEGDYHLTDRLTISAQKEIKADRSSFMSDPDSYEKPDDRILLRYRSRF